MSLPTPIESIKLFNRRYGVRGDMSYGADGFLYKLVPTKRSNLIWLQIDKNNEADYYQWLQKILNSYQIYINKNNVVYLKTTNPNGWPKKNMMAEHDMAKRNINREFGRLLNILFPKRFQCKNFGKSNNGYLEDGYGTYLLLRVMHYYGIKLSMAGIKAKSGPKKDLSGLNFFEETMEFIEGQIYDNIFIRYYKILPTNKLEIWEITSPGLNFGQKVRLLTKLLGSNLRTKHNLRLTKKYLVQLININQLLQRVIKFNIIKKQTTLRYYFDLFRLLRIDLVNIVHYLRQYLLPMNLAQVVGTLNSYDHGHLTGLSRIGFGYGLYYLIENEYIRENTVWIWPSSIY